LNVSPQNHDRVKVRFGRATALELRACHLKTAFRLGGES
jgi:hypothetical protein